MLDCLASRGEEFEEPRGGLVGKDCAQRVEKSVGLGIKRVERSVFG